ncbi:MAG TPA: hypothetical protein VF160_11400 [Candidatus Dormibacteraeota bacterium]
MSRALTIFLVGVIVVITFGAFARDVLGLSCVGPQLPVWGCLSEPLPDTLPGNMGMLWYLFLAAVGFAICYVVRDIVYLLGQALGRRVFPHLAKAAGVEAETPQRSYRIR